MSLKCFIFQLYAAPVSGDEYDNAAQYELIELSPEEVEELLSEIHTPSVDHLLLPSDYIDVEEAEDVPAADYHLPDYYQDDDEEEEQIEQLKQLEHLLEGKFLTLYCQKFCKLSEA